MTNNRKTWHIRVAWAALAMFPAVAFAQASGSVASDEQRSGAGFALLLLILLLLIVVLVFGWFFMRAMQRSRKRLGHTRPEPTDATDVWSMHKLPESDVEDADSGNGFREGEA